MWDFISDRRGDILFLTWQHALLVFYAIVVATAIAVFLAVLVTRAPRTAGLANTLSAIGLTIPSFALIGLLLPVVSLGPTIGLVAVTFYAILPILRNAVVGLQGVDETLLESAKGMGMSELSILRQVRLPLAWPVILAGVRTSTQMSMGIAAIAAYALGPGLGGYIFRGITQIGSSSGTYYVVVGTVGVIIIALIADALLLLLGRITISKGIRA